MKKTLALLLTTFAAGACTVTADAPEPAAAGDTCDAVSCGEALTSGLSASGEPICDPASDSDYGAVQSCGCDLCGDVCGDNLCLDLGETSDCGDCLNQECPAEHEVCAND